MTLQASGNAIKFSEIQTEFGGSNPISLSEYFSGGSYVPSNTTGYPGGTATTIPSSPNTIRASSFYGSSAVVIYNPISLSPKYYSESDTSSGPYCSINIVFYTNGTIQAAAATSNVPGSYSLVTGTQRWASGGSTVGNNYWIRFTRTAFSGSGNYAATASSGWQQLSSACYVNIYAAGISYGGGNNISGYCSATYTVEISTNSSGTNIVSTTTGVGANVSADFGDLLP